jgi:hypothetical protein
VTTFYTYPELTPKSTKVAGLGQDSQRENRTDARDLLQTLEVGVVLHVERRSLLELSAQLTEMDHLSKHGAEHGNGFGI